MPTKLNANKSPPSTMITLPAAPHVIAITTLESDDEDELGMSIWKTSRTARLFSAKKMQQEEGPGIKATTKRASRSIGGGDGQGSKCTSPAAIGATRSRKTVTFAPAVKFNDLDHDDISVGVPMAELAKGSKDKETPRSRESAFALHPWVESHSLRERKSTLFFNNKLALQEKHVAWKQKLQKEETPWESSSPQEKKAPPESLDHSGQGIQVKEVCESLLKPSAVDQIELNLKPVKKSNCAAGVYERRRKWVSFHTIWQ